ncbi:unnamed protein product [Trifolium pratense]|uniref:Uncharacterized protein n=1 Tax=Trifolium pratense TaxID=57577 RepID=A0ACB0JPV7_TRIPR|nr:unnamed protein product [Trifolium pratense]
MSERNKSNKAKQVINHICGRKSFQAISYDARDPEIGKEPNFQDLWQMTHMKNSGEWIDGTREVYLKVQEVTSEILQDINEDVDEDQIINEAFQSIVGKRIGYCRGLGVGIKPTRGKSSALNQELASERKKRHDIKMKLKEVEAQLQEERHKREEMETQFEETQRQLEEPHGEAT